MKSIISKAFTLTLSALTLVVMSGCTAKAGPTGEAKEDWHWPEHVHIAAPGQSGLAKYVSWASLMEADTGMAIRVVPEADPGV